MAMAMESAIPGIWSERTSAVDRGLRMARIIRVLGNHEISAGATTCRGAVDEMYGILLIDRFRPGSHGYDAARLSFIAGDLRMDMSL